MNRSDVEQLPLRAYRISNGALLSAPNLPSRLKLLNWGRNESIKGPVILGAKSASLLPVLQPQFGFSKVALDFEHNTVPGTDAYKETAEPRPVAAFGVPKVIPNDGLYLEEIEWTPRGKSEALNFADLSPAVKQDDAGEVVFIHSTALTRNGAVHELSFYNVRTNQRESMDENNVLTVGELGQALGLSGTATKAAVISRLAALSAVAVLVSHGADGKPKVAIVDDVKSLSASVGALTTALAEKGAGVVVFSATVDGKPVTLKPEELTGKVLKLETAFEQNGLSALNAERQTIIAALSSEGKAPINPETGIAYSAEELGKLEVPLLKVLRANTPATVPLSARGKRPNENKGGEGLSGASRAAAGWAHLEK